MTFSASNLLPIWSSAETDIASGQKREGPFANQIPSQLVYVASGRRLYLVDLSSRSVETIFESPAEIGSFAPLDLRLSAAEGDPVSPLLAVRTSDSIHVLDRQGGLLMSFAIPTADRENLLLLYAPGRRSFFAEFYRPRICDANRNVDPRVVYRINADGSTVEPTPLSLDSGMLKWHKQPTATALRWALPAPAVLPPIESCMIVFIDGEPDLGAAAAAMLRHSWPSLLGILGFSSLLAAASWRSARAFALPLPERAAWAVFVLLAGLPGYAGFRLHRIWPVRRPCPRCGAIVPWDRGECAACAAPFPAAVPAGIEVFC